MKKIQLENEISVLVDDADYEKVSKIKWHLSKRGYTQTFINGKRIYLHRMIMWNEIKKSNFSLVVDHINHDPLDNRKSNLRLVTKSQNSANKIVKNYYGFRGIAYSLKYNSWYAKISINGKTVTDYPYNTAEDAAKAYDRLAKKYHGCAAVLNFPE